MHIICVRESNDDYEEEETVVVIERVMVVLDGGVGWVGTESMCCMTLVTAEGT